MACAMAHSEPSDSWHHDWPLHGACEPAACWQVLKQDRNREWHKLQQRALAAASYSSTEAFVAACAHQGRVQLAAAGTGAAPTLVLALRAFDVNAEMQLRSASRTSHEPDLMANHMARFIFKAAEPQASEFVTTIRNFARGMYQGKYNEQCPILLQATVP